MTFFPALIRKACRRFLRNELSDIPPLPDFGNLTYAITTRPSSARLKAWPKLEECERRLVFFQYAVRLTEIDEPRYRVLVDDAMSAFLWSFEATLQFVRDEFPGTDDDFWDWLNKPQPGYDLNLDLDGDMGRTSRFDGAHGRFSLYW